MKKIYLFGLIGLLFISCNDYKYNTTLNKIKIKYDLKNENKIDNYKKFLENLNSVSYLTQVKYNNLQFTYTTNINPKSIGFDNSFYKFIDTTNIVKCKGIYYIPLLPPLTTKLTFTEITITDTNGNYIENIKDYEYEKILDILSTKAFIQFKNF